MPDADAHFANDPDQFQFDAPEAAGFGGREYYERMHRKNALYHTRAGGSLGTILDRHDALVFSRNPFRKRHRGAHTKPPHLREDGGVALKVGNGNAGSSTYIALQMAAASGFLVIRLVGLDMNARKFDGAHGWTGFGKRQATTVAAWSNSQHHDRVWAAVPDDVRARVRV